MLKWLKSHWYVPLLTLAGVLAWFFRITREKPTDTWKIESKAATAAAEAKEIAIKSGAELARAKVRAEHQEELNRLNKEQAEHAEQLAEDPAALARFLVRVGQRGG